jgi:hypothetical protein
MNPKPQFTAQLDFHFREHGPERRRWFMFAEDLHRRVPLQMEGVEGLNTVGMWVNEPGTFKTGESVVVQCVVIAPELYSTVVKPGVKFELWDGGFFASGTVLERIEEGWPSDA